MTAKKKRTYRINTAPETDKVIAVPKKDEKGTTPKVIEVTEADKKKLRLYIAAKRAVARHEQGVKALAGKHGKLSYLSATITPQVSKTYEYDAELQAEIDALDEKKKAARVDGGVIVTEGAISLRFADKKAKAKDKKKGAVK